MRVVFMGRKPVASEALEYMVNKGIEIVAVVVPARDEPSHWSPKLIDTAQRYSLFTTPDGIQYIDFKGYAEIDLVISLLYRKKICKPLIDLPKIGCINFHPAPLPEVRGYVGYNLGIYENVTSWGISAHFVDENFDTGDIIKVLRFDIDPEKETAFTLEQKSQPYLLELFKDVIDMALETGSLPRTPQGKGRYFSKKDFESLRKIQPEDTLEDIERKIRAFWYPPYDGASIELRGKQFTLVNEDVVKDIGRRYHS